MAMNDDMGDEPVHIQPTVMYTDGMTLRQWYAGQALAGIGSGYSSGNFQRLIEDVWRLADALIEAEAKDD